MIEATMIEGGTSCWGDRYRNYPSLYYGVQQYILLHSTPRINISNIKPLSPFSTSPACHPMGALCRYIIHKQAQVWRDSRCQDPSLILLGI